MCVFLQISCKYSNDILAHWEREQKSLISDKKLKRPDLQAAIRLCGLSASMSAKNLRIVCVSLRKHKLPSCQAEVDLLLKDAYNQPISGALNDCKCVIHLPEYPLVYIFIIAILSGPGFRSPQQRKLRLLEKLDPILKKAMGTDIIKAGNYKWSESMTPELTQTIVACVLKWQEKDQLPPWGYKISNEVDMANWTARRVAGLRWVESSEAKQFAKLVYQTYAQIFGDVTKNQGTVLFEMLIDIDFPLHVHSPLAQLAAH